MYTLTFYEFPQAYRLFFMSPSSAGGENDASEITSRRHDVATTLRLNNHVTPRSIAYAATQESPYDCSSISFLILSQGCLFPQQFERVEASTRWLPLPLFL